MATTVGTLAVNIRTNSGEFTRSMKKNTGAVKNFRKGVSFAKTAVVALAGAGGLGLLIKASLTTIDTLGKTADKLGLTTEALAGLRHAAELTGASSGTLDMALQRMTRRLSEAAQGTGEAKDALKELGLDAQRLAALSPDQAFIEIASAMQKVSNEGDKVRLSFKLFDSEGVALKNTLALGEQGLIDATKAVGEYGVALNSVDTKAVESLNDELTRSKAAAQGLANSVTTTLAPVIERMARGFQESVKHIREFFGFEFLNDTEKLASLEKERVDLNQQLDAVITELNPKERAAAKERLLDVRDEIGLLLRKKQIQDEQLAAATTADETKTGLKLEVDDATKIFDSHIENYRRFQGKQTEIAKQEAARRAQIEQEISDQIVNMKMGVFQHAANFLRAVAPESKKAAIAVLVIEKGLAIAQVAINTEVAAMRALAELGPILGAAAAADIRFLGGASIGFIIGTGLAQGASILSGDSGQISTVGSQTPSEAALGPFGDGFSTPTQQGSITINLNGVITDQVVQDLVIPAIQDAVDERDVVLIRNDSRNGQELISNG